jgi:methionine biosynthesis protein MetW
LFKGRMPRTRALDYSWHDTPNIHLCTLTDFIALAHEEGAAIERAMALREDGRTQEMNPGSWGPNILAQGAIFLLRGAR